MILFKFHLFVRLLHLAVSFEHVLFSDWTDHVLTGIDDLGQVTETQSAKELLVQHQTLDAAFFLHLVRLDLSWC